MQNGPADWSPGCILLPGLAKCLPFSIKYPGLFLGSFIATYLR
jgi:hypothetical protein